MSNTILWRNLLLRIKTKDGRVWPIANQECDITTKTPNSSILYTKDGERGPIVRTFTKIDEKNLLTTQLWHFISTTISTIVSINWIFFRSLKNVEYIYIHSPGFQGLYKNNTIVTSWELEFSVYSLRLSQILLNPEFVARIRCVFMFKCIMLI